MRFIFNGIAYVLEFSYGKRRVHTYVGKIVESRYPYTTASILVMDDTNKNTDEWEVYQKAEVGVLKGDKFDKVQGRLLALKKLMLKVPKEMRPMIWEVYHNRPDKKMTSVSQLKKANTQLRKELALVREQYTNLLRDSNGS